MTKHILLALIAAFALAACDSDSTPPPPAGDPPAKERPFTDPDRR